MINAVDAASARIERFICPPKGRVQARPFGNRKGHTIKTGVDGTYKLLKIGCLTDLKAEQLPSDYRFGV